MRWTRILAGTLTRIAFPLLVAVGAAAFFYYRRGWVFTLAVWTGLALGLLLYALLERIQVLRRLYRRPPR
jgi:hypothetical protein